MKDVAFTAKTGTGKKDDKGKEIMKEIPGSYKAYENIKEALAALGEEKVVARVNRIQKADAMTALREQRAPSMAGLYKKLDPKGKAEIDAILKKYGHTPIAA